MSKGWDPVQQAAEETAAARARAQETFLPELRVNQRNTGPFVIRFLEQGPDVHSYPVHEYKVPSQGQFVARRFTCLSEVGLECPGCKAGLKRKVRGVFNLIQRNRPVYRKGQDNKALKDPGGNYIIDGYQDQVVVANVGGPTSEMLRNADGSYHGLMSRDFQVIYSGDTFQSWNMTPVMDAQGNAVASPLSENDQALLATRHDLDKYMAPPPQQEAAQIVARYAANSGGSAGGAPAGVGGVGGPQGNAGLAQQPNQFLTGATAGAGAPVNAFGGAAPPAAVPGPPAPPPASMPPAAPAQTVPPADVPVGVHPAGQEQQTQPPASAGAPAQTG